MPRVVTPDSPLATALASIEAEAAVLERHGAKEAATAKRADAEAVRQAIPDALTWLSESEASLRSGWPVAKVRRHARLFVETPYVARVSGRWRLLAIIVPRRIAAEIYEQAAREAAEAMAG